MFDAKLGKKVKKAALGFDHPAPVPSSAPETVEKNDTADSKHKSKSKRKGEKTSGEDADLSKILVAISSAPKGEAVKRHKKRS